MHTLENVWFLVQTDSGPLLNPPRSLISIKCGALSYTRAVAVCPTPGCSRQRARAGAAESELGQAVARTMAREWCPLLQCDAGGSNPMCLEVSYLETRPDEATHEPTFSTDVSL